MPPSSHHIYGIRHHGPGSAKSLVRALERLRPDLILVEGPAEANDIIMLAAHDSMRPPVALLVYESDTPKNGVFYPFARFSPEWCAIQYGIQNKVPVRFMDLPQSQHLAIEKSGVESLSEPHSLRGDPLRLLAEAAGYEDSERWWDAMIESRDAGDDIFAAIQEAMTALREELPAETDKIEDLREAAMRQIVRKGGSDGFQNMAVVCGAWHVPALVDVESPAKNDAAMLRALPTVKTSATWVPWTNSRLALRSGYGAGIQSPGWYEHLWSHPKDVTTLWMIRVAHLLRENDLDSSPAHIIEAVRLADTLTALRGLSMPGLMETNEAVQTVFCYGSSTPLKLISEKLIIGNVLGMIPDETPAVPLQRDFERLQKKLRLSCDIAPKSYDLDLRKPNDLERSLFLHRVDLLDISWGRIEQVRGVKGTFHELWNLQWRPELAINIIEASIWGSSVADAAGSYAVSLAHKANNLPSLTILLGKVFNAELSEAVHVLLEQLQNRSAFASDIGDHLSAIPPLVNLLRYGAVRKTDSSLVAAVVTGLVSRSAIGLPVACSSLDEDAAGEMLHKIVLANSAIILNDDAELLSLWREAIQKLDDNDGIHGLIAGRSNRILLDCGYLTREESGSRMRLALSPSNGPLYSAAWLEGFLEKSGQLLLLDQQLWNLVDQWLSELGDSAFIDLLPLVRRIFSTFTVAERRQMGQQVKSEKRQNRTGVASEESYFDVDSAESALPLLRLILGLNAEEAAPAG
jgi:hypothetical protein